ncbi:hypothetical protein [Azospirillum sp.]|uniref:hypothetical protein n=1 Tax=Azospirillum sp. TaxID=34012 RepID=UPI002D66E297|nr:hypothetical protein [Azospirillum sp.]HYD64840.1 hypothetical protein [Azospirillum sp.]
MTVVAFSRARFTPSDLVEFEQVAEPKLRLGHWAGIIRESGRDFDRLLVLLPGVDRPVFRFERGAGGTYTLCFNDRVGWYGIGSGPSAAECLAIWRPRTRKSRSTAAV